MLLKIKLVEMCWYENCSILCYFLFLMNINSSFKVKNKLGIGSVPKPILITTMF